MYKFDIFTQIFVFLTLFGCQNKVIDQNNFESKTGYDYKLLFSFEKVQPINNVWHINTGKNNYFGDHSCRTEGTYSLRISDKKKLNSFEAQIFQYFSVPFKSNHIVFNIDSKSLNIENAWLKVICYDSRENLIKKDSVSLIEINGWHTYELAVSADSICNLYVEISAKSKKGFLSRKSFHVDNLQVLCNSHRPFSFSNDNTILDMNQISIIDSINYESLNSIVDLKKNKIISIGESIHGSLECEKIANEIIKYQIIHNKCRLVLREMPFNIGIALNNYITGKSSINVEKLVAPFKINIPEFILFIEWLKEYNSKAKEKVIFLGIDENYILLEKNFLIELLRNSNPGNNEVTKTIKLFEKKDYLKTIDRITNYHSLQSLDKMTQNIVKLGLEVFIYLNGRTSSLDEWRDHLMFRISDYAIIEMLDDSSTAVIYSHLAHSNKLNNYTKRLEVTNFGSLMLNKFKDEYFTIALLVGNGTISNGINLKRKSNFKLEIPKDESLEKLCDDNSDSNFYYRITKDLKTTTGRIVGGNFSTIQFFPSSAIKRFDSFIFIKNSHGYKIPKDWPRNPYEYVKKFKNSY